MLSGASQVGKALCLTIDTQEAALYWVVAATNGQDTHVIRLFLKDSNAQPETIITLPKAIQQKVSGIAAFQVSQYQIPP